MSLLFEAPLIEGLRYREELISAGDERTLLARLGSLGAPGLYPAGRFKGEPCVS